VRKGIPTAWQIISTKTPGSGAGNVNEPRLM